MTFYLNCWVPSLQNYVKIQELTVKQLGILAKYLVNEDNEGINYCFNEIIKNNLKDPDLFDKLDKLDKWFILSFLKASNISPLIIIKAKNPDDTDCTIDLSLIDILTQVSEYKYRFENKLEIKNFIATFQIPKELYTENILADAVNSVQLDDKIIDFSRLPHRQKIQFFLSLEQTLHDLLLSYTKVQDGNNDAYLIKNVNNLKNLFDIKLNLFDNTLFAFLKSIYFPYVQSLYGKKYNLVSKIGLSLAEIDNLTPFETDIYINILNTEEKSLAEKKDISR